MEPNGTASSEVSTRRLHRIREVREKEDLSLRKIACRTGIKCSHLQAQEDPFSDLRLTDLYAWQAALDVPLCELLVETNGGLSEPVRQRALLVKICKTAKAIIEEAESEAVCRLTDRLLRHLMLLLPNLDDIAAWPKGGRLSSIRDIGRAALHGIPTELRDCDAYCETYHEAVEH